MMREYSLERKQSLQTNTFRPQTHSRRSSNGINIKAMNHRDGVQGTVAISPSVEPSGFWIK